MKFVDPKSDIAFKKIFGDQNHHDALLEFLNTVLDLSAQITELEILNPYQAPRLSNLKETLLDVKARDQAGHEFIIEMQVEKQRHFTKPDDMGAQIAYRIATTATIIRFHRTVAIKHLPGLLAANL